VTVETAADAGTKLAAEVDRLLVDDAPALARADAHRSRRLDAPRRRHRAGLGHPDVLGARARRSGRRKRLTRRSPDATALDDLRRRRPTET
jgi:hypothetical protein